MSEAPAPLPRSSWSVALPDEAATAALARRLAAMLRPGDLVTLSGDLGAGKTTFARALIRTLTDDPTLDVPSPTFTLMQVYASAAFPVVHADLYRISSADELAELGWEEAAEDSVVLVEWPERVAFLVNAERLDVALRLVPGGQAGERHVEITGTGAWAERVTRERAVQAVLEAAGWTDAARTYVQGDASVRLYERLSRDGETAILMIAPPRAPSPPIRMGKSYPQIARLSDTVHAFVGMDNGLRAQGVTVPRILTGDLEAGVLLIEDLGSEGIVDADGPMPERYAEVVGVLAHLHGRDLPATVPVEPGVEHAIPPYDMDALLIEAELALDWYMPHIVGTTPSGSARSTFVSLWRGLLDPMLAQPTTWTLRDVHSPNVLWQAGREGMRRAGLIDFQDAVLGHPAYDLAALLQDARVDVPQALELKLLGHYARLRGAAKPFDMAAFAQAYAIFGAQRSTKILGTFTRLDRRDGKPDYLRHLPRVEGYVRRNLAHPVLSGLKVWYEANLPSLFATP